MDIFSKDFIIYLSLLVASIFLVTMVIFPIFTDADAKTIDSTIDSTISILVNSSLTDNSTRFNMEQLIFLLEEKYGCGNNTAVIQEDYCSASVSRGQELTISISWPLNDMYGRPVE